jgi:hypothetical protein
MSRPVLDARGARFLELLAAVVCSYANYVTRKKHSHCLQVGGMARARESTRSIIATI